MGATALGQHHSLPSSLVPVRKKLLGEGLELKESGLHQRLTRLPSPSSRGGPRHHAHWSRDGHDKHEGSERPAADAGVAGKPAAPSSQVRGSGNEGEEERRQVRIAVSSKAGLCMRRWYDCAGEEVADRCEPQHGKGHKCLAALGLERFQPESGLEPHCACCRGDCDHHSSSPAACEDTKALPGLRIEEHGLRVGEGCNGVAEHRAPRPLQRWPGDHWRPKPQPALARGGQGMELASHCYQGKASVRQHMEHCVDKHVTRTHGPAATGHSQGKVSEKKESHRQRGRSALGESRSRGTGDGHEPCPVRGPDLF
mmetsp:Transcript_13987/g.40972  ORF Transcript_13987/g.40972 Transcript_13987/m.40972 type:complete len:312 (+) Transcript_13987:962-1897(+)